MGASVSRVKTTNEIITDVLTNIVIEFTNNCNNSNSNIQTIAFNDLEFVGCDVNFSNISQLTNSTITTNCSQSSEAMTDVTNKAQTELQNELTSKISGLNIGLSASDVQSSNKLINDIKTNIDISSMINCITNSLNTQLQTFTKIKATCKPGQSINFDNIKQVIISNQVSDCLQTNSVVTKAANDLDTLIKNKLSSSVEGLSFDIIIVIIVVVFVIICSSSVSGAYIYIK